MSLKPGTILNERYLIETILGEGGMGAVYRAQDMFRAKQLVAVKEFRLKHLPSEEELNLYQKGKSSDEIITREKSLAQFKLEAQLLAGLDHPNLPKVTDHFASGKDYYIVMTLIVGKDAATLLSSMNGKPLPERAVYVWMRQVMDAVIYCHSKGVIHRDIKPANIILTVSGTVYLVDFGIAKLDSPSKATSLGARVVTPGFSPPEQYSLGRTDARSDIYSLGATLYAMLTGHQPIESINRYMGVPMPDPHELVPNINPALEEVILKAVDLQPEYRYQSVLEMKQAFSAVFGVPVAPPVGVGQREEEKKIGAQEETSAAVSISAEKPEKPNQSQPVPTEQNEPPKPPGVTEDLPRGPAPSPQPGRARPRNFLQSLFATGKESNEPGLPNLPLERKKKQEVNFGEPILRIGWAVQGDILSVITGRGLYLFDREKTRLLWQQEAGWQSPCRVAFSPDRSFLAAASANQVRLWNLMNGEVIKSFTLDISYPVMDLVVQESGSVLVAGANPEYHKVKIWELHSMREVFTVEEARSQPINVVFSPGGKVCAAVWSGYTGAGTVEGSVRLYDLILFQQFYQLPTHPSIPTVLAFGYGETVLAVGSGTRMNLRNFRVFKPPSALEMFGKDHATQVIDVSFDPDTEIAATVGDDGSVKIWDLYDRSEILLDRFTQIQNGLSVSFSPKQRLAAVGTVDGVLYLYPVQKARL